MADRQRSALVGEGFPGELVVSAAVVARSYSASAWTRPAATGATRSGRPSWSRSVTSSPETAIGVAQVLERDLVEVAQPVVEDGDRRRAVGGEDQVEVAVAVDVQAATPVCGATPP